MCKETRDTLTLAGLVEQHLRLNGHHTAYTRLDDGSGTSVELTRRSGGTEYIISLSFNEAETELQNIEVYAGQVTESVDHKKII